ncbi:MAG: hypothetical protein AB8B72_13575 [Crocinitomicaceae bacterium]
MKYILLMLTSVFVISCGGDAVSEKILDEVIQEVKATKTPNDKLRDAYQLFKEGDDKGSIQLANEVLELGRQTNNDTLIGGALTSLCRNAQRSLDTIRLAELSSELINLSESSGDKKWMMYRAHMNAEMWRLIGNMDKAESFYDESMEISLALNARGMYTIDHFNKSFVSTAKGNYQDANDLILRYYELRKEDSGKVEDAYGLIALAYLLEQQKNYEGAHEVATVTRRLFEEQNLFPEPPDEKPLIAVEEEVKAELDAEKYEKINTNAATQTVSSLLDKYLK